MPSLPPDAAAVAGYQAAMRTLRGRVAAYAMATWSSQTSYRGEDVDAIVARLLPYVRASQAQAANLTAQYVAALARLAGRDPGTVVVDIAAAIRGIDPATVYRRPVVDVWTALARGELMDDAVRAGAARLRSLATTDVQLAAREAARQAMGTVGASGYRRQTSGNACDLCETVSDAVYSRDDLMPIHPGCGCVVIPVFGGEPIQRATPDGVDVHEHGELGPVLTNPDHEFTGPESVPGAIANADKIANAATMFGTGSPQHLEAIRRFGD